MSPPIETLVRQLYAFKRARLSKMKSLKQDNQGIAEVDDDACEDELEMNAFEEVFQAAENGGLGDFAEKPENLQ